MRIFAAILLASMGLQHMPAVAQETYDLVIYGGTSGGVAAAVQARRMDKTAIVIEPGKHLGGLTSGGLGATDIGNKAAIGGISRGEKHYADPANWKYEKPETTDRADGLAGPGRRHVDIRAALGRAAV
jgi:hypothetical protein